MNNRQGDLFVCEKTSLIRSYRRKKSTKKKSCTLSRKKSIISMIVQDINRSLEMNVITYWESCDLRLCQSMGIRMGIGHSGIDNFRILTAGLDLA